MISSGYLKFCRGWKYDPESPFYGIKRRTYYEVWRELCEQADYVKECVVTYGVVSLTVAELSDATGIPHRSCLNAIKYIADHGLITIKMRKPKMSIAINRYELLESFSRYIGRESTNGIEAEKSGVQVSCYENRDKITEIESTKKSGARQSIDKIPTSLTKSVCKKTIWRTPDLSGAHLAHDKGGLMSGNDKENRRVEKSSGDDLAHETPFLISKEDITTTLTSSSRRLAHKRKPKRQPSESELAIATFWNDIITRHSKSNLLTVEEQVEGLISFIDKAKVSTDLIMEVLTWAATNKYWRSQVRCLEELYLPSRQSKSVRRFQAMVSDWEYQQDNSKKPKAEATKWVGKYV